MEAVLTLTLLASSCDVKSSYWARTGYRGTVEAPPDEVIDGVQKTLAAFGAEAPDAGASDATFVVEGTEIRVEVTPAEGEGAVVFVACDCAPSVPREVLEAILDDQEAMGRTTIRPSYGTISEPTGDTPVLDELRRRRGR